MSPLLEIRNLRTYFRTTAGVYRAADGVDLSLDPGRTLCLVGESGSGKSVTALSVMRLVGVGGSIEPGSKILFGGRNLACASEAEMLKIRGHEIAMIFQEPSTSLDPVYTVGYQIAEAVRAQAKPGQKVTRKAALQRAAELMRLVGIAEPQQRACDYPHQMSGGMLQRVMIAIALAGNPRLLIADEPTTALDATIQAQILELLKELQVKFGMAILMITHNFGVVAEMADDVAVMYAGRVVERGSAASVFTAPQHPYTQALLRSVPVLGMTIEDLHAIPGSVPSPLGWPAGCRFAPRCQHAFERCRLEQPPLTAAGTQESACWLTIRSLDKAREVQH